MIKMTMLVAQLKLNTRHIQSQFLVLPPGDQWRSVCCWSDGSKKRFFFVSNFDPLFTFTVPY